MAKAADSKPSGFGLSSSISWWKFLWRLRIPPKVKLFIWKAVHNWIPTAINLISHGIKIDPLCRICLKKVESSIHVLWCCPRLKDVRNGCLFVTDGKNMESMSFFDFVCLCRLKVDVLYFEFLCVVWWRV